MEYAILFDYLSDGTMIEVTRQGKTFTFLHTGQGPTDEPEIKPGLTEDEALDLYANTLRADVMELD